MNAHESRWLAGAMTFAACALIATGCGGSDSSSSSTESSTSSDSAQSRIDAAVESCNSKAQELGEAGAAALQAACTTVGDNVSQALSSGGEQVDQALAQAADACNSAAGQLPAGEAQDALTQLCDAIGAS